MNTPRIVGLLQVLSLFLLIDLATEAQAATYSFKSLDVPGSTTETSANSINASGQVAGYYHDAADNIRGFVYSEEKYTFLDPPGAHYAIAKSINDSGQVMGDYSDASGRHGFVYSKGQYTTLNPPGATTTYAYSINDSGQVAGFYSSAVGIDGHGFVYSNGQYTSLDVPGARGSTVATSINANGQVTGYYYIDTLDINGHGFVYSEGQYTSLDVPGATATYAYNINASGQVIGDYSDASGRHGFVYSEGQYTSLDVPGAQFIYTRSINENGQVTGDYINASGDHGFVYSEGQYTSLDVPGATATLANSINASGQVVGSYFPGGHGFIAIPMTPFSAFNVTQLVIDQNRGSLFLWSNFTLGGDNNGIDPVKEEVTLKIANATLTIPAGSFHKNSHPSFFAFAGQVDNVWIEAFIRPSGSNRFRFQVLAYGAPLGDTKNPVPVELTMGDDKGTTTANASLQ